MPPRKKDIVKETPEVSNEQRLEEPVLETAEDAPVLTEPVEPILTETEDTVVTIEEPNEASIVTPQESVVEPAPAIEADEIYEVGMLANRLKKGEVIDVPGYGRCVLLFDQDAWGYCTVSSLGPNGDMHLKLPFKKS